MVAPRLILPAGHVPDRERRCRLYDPCIESERLVSTESDCKNTCRVRGCHRIDLLHPARERQPGKVQADLVREGVRKNRRKATIGDERLTGIHHRFAEPVIKRLCKPELLRQPVERPAVETNKNWGDGDEVREDLIIFHGMPRICGRENKTAGAPAPPARSHQIKKNPLYSSSIVPDPAKAPGRWRMSTMSSIALMIR